MVRIKLTMKLRWTDESQVLLMHYIYLCTYRVYNKARMHLGDAFSATTNKNKQNYRLPPYLTYPIPQRIPVFGNKP